MRKIILAICLTGLLANVASAQSFFDTLQQKSRDALKAIETVKEPEKGASQKGEGQEPSAAQSGSAANGGAIKDASDLYGRREGTVQPPAHGSQMEAMGLDVLITPEFGSLLASGTLTRCMAELKPAGKLGEYEAAFIDESKSCGTKASLSFEDGGKVTIDWTDMPGLSSNKRTYTGQLKLTREPFERRWSASADQREQFDTVGLKLGMTYENALAYLEAKHPDLASEGAIVTDKGTTSIIDKLTEKGVKKLGSDVFGEQITLFFESQTRDEMQVEQDPVVMAKVRKREKVMAEREKMINEHRSSSRTRGMDRDWESKLPKVPPMPKLRPEGAGAELLIISRRLLFTRNHGPHMDNVIEAMNKKYGEPSIHLKALSSAGGKHQLEWVFDGSNERIEGGEGGDCDHISPYATRKEQTRLFSPTGGIKAFFNAVMVSPRCGMTVKAEVNVNGDGSVYRISTTVYDQQRLIGDDWHRAVELRKALITTRKAKTKALQERDVPDF